MHLEDALDILQIARRRRPVVHTFRDRSALLALALDVGPRGRRVADIKASPRAGLLRRAPVQEVVTRLRGDVLRAEDLLTWWPVRTTPYVLSFGTWGRDDGRSYWQTTRSGSNVVVRLNFARDHDREARSLLGLEFDADETQHPVDRAGRNTLAWVRVDVDVDHGEALIEEVQSDWVRDARTVHDDVLAGRRPSPWTWHRCRPHVTPRGVRLYNDRVLAPHARTWAESALTATIEMLVREVGVTRVFMHTWETGNLLKRIAGDRQPPRSLYTDLPRRFAFDVTSRPPQFLQETACGRTRYVLRHREPRFHVLEWTPEAVREAARLL